MHSPHHCLKDHETLTGMGQERFGRTHKLPESKALEREPSKPRMHSVKQSLTLNSQSSTLPRHHTIPGGKLKQENVFGFVCTVFCPCIYMSVINVSGTFGDQKKIIDPLNLEVWMVMSYHGCWGPNSGPLQEQVL